MASFARAAYMIRRPSVEGQGPAIRGVALFARPPVAQQDRQIESTDRAIPIKVLRTLGVAPGGHIVRGDHNLQP